MGIFRKIRHMWYSIFRDERTGRFMSKEQAKAADPDDVMEHKRKRKQRM